MTVEQLSASGQRNPDRGDSGHCQYFAWDLHGSSNATLLKAVPISREASAKLTSAFDPLRTLRAEPCDFSELPRLHLSAPAKHKVRAQLYEP